MDKHWVLKFILWEHNRRLVINIDMIIEEANRKMHRLLGTGLRLWKTDIWGK